jgi:protein CpxP
MKSIFKPVLLVGLLAVAGFSVFAQPAGHPMHEGMGPDRMERMNPARMQAWMDKRNAVLKTQLKLSAAQEAGWSTYVAAMKPPADLMNKRSEHAELEKLPTPERIDKMKTLHAQHMVDMSAAMDKRGDATKTFYTTLTPEQKKVFDESAQSHHGGKGHMKGYEASKAPAQTKP